MKPAIINLGDRVKDRISGFTGIAVARSEFLYGCVRVGVHPEKAKDGKAVESDWFDEQQLKVVKRGVVKPPETAVQQRPAGPRSAPQRAADATR